MTEKPCTMLAYTKCLARYHDNLGTQRAISIGLCIWTLVVPFVCLGYIVVFAVFLKRLYSSKYHKSFATTMSILLKEKKFIILAFGIFMMLVVSLDNIVQFSNPVIN